MKKKLFIGTLTCLLVMYGGWIAYNQMFPIVVTTHARYKYHFESESQIAELADAVIKVKALGN